jgi:hypothetical protein
MRFTLVLLLCLLCLRANPVFAAGDPPGFQSLQEFVEALDEMPAETFQAYGAHTPIADLRAWRGILLEVNPVSYEAWNLKMKLLPGIGFNHDTSQWLLQVTSISPVSQIGFTPGTEREPFRSVMDLYQSLKQDPSEVVAFRLNGTSRNDLFNWLHVIERVNPVLYNLSNFRLALVHRVGFNVNEYWNGLPPSHVVVSGFLPSSPDARLVITSYEDLEQLVAGTDITNADQAILLERRFQATGPKVLGPMLVKLKGTVPDTYGKLVSLSQFRIAIGFRTQAHPNAELISQRLPVVQVQGFLPEFDCNEAMDFETL